LDEDESEAPLSSRPRMEPWRKVGIVVACGFIVLGAVILVAHFVQARQPGQASSGSISQTQAQQIEEQLAQALTLNNSGNVKGALELYNKVLGEDPSNPAALAYAGYLEWDEGTAAHAASLARIGRAQIETAIRDAPTYYEAHLFYGLVLPNQDHNDKGAVVQFDEYLNDGPPPAEPPEVEAEVLGAYQGAHEPVPAAFTSGGPTTSSP
jgi:tetratricopeptide (TPR) repeat protein